MPTEVSPAAPLDTVVDATLDISVPAAASGVADRTVGNGVAFTPLGSIDPFDTATAVAGGTRLTLDECVALGSGRWRFTGRIDARGSHERSTMQVVLGWLFITDTGPYNDLGFAVEVRGTGGPFTVEVDQRHSALDAFVDDPVGAQFDLPCGAWISTTSLPDAAWYSYVGPTSATVAGPRPAPNGRYLPTPAWPAPQTPDLAGWLTGVELLDGFHITDPTFGPYRPGTAGPMIVDVGDRSVTVPADTPGAWCGVVRSINAGADAAGPGAQTTGCLVLVDLDEDDVAARVSYVGGRAVAWDGGWDEAFRPQTSVTASASALHDGHAVFDAFLHDEPALRLPLADDVTIDCPPERGFDPFDRASMEIPASVDVLIDVASVTVTVVTCENYFIG